MTVNFNPGVTRIMIYTVTQGVMRDEIQDHMKERSPKCDPDEPS